MAGGIDSFTKLCLHMDGVNNGTVFTDSSSNPHTVSRVNAVTKTGTKKFGSASGYFDGSGDYLSVPNSPDWAFGSGNFTIDLWFRQTEVRDQRLFSQYVNNGSRWYIYYQPSTLGISTAGGGIASWSASLSINIWYHLAIVRENDDWKLFVDGVSQGTVVNAATFPNLSSPLYIGVDWYNSSPSSQSKGYMDELRLSKGIARWTSNFTPPTQAYYAYSISGDLSDDARIVIIDKSSGSMEYNDLVSAGAYSIPAVGNSEKLIAAFKEDTGETIGYGKVIPVL